MERLKTDKEPVVSRFSHGVKTRRVLRVAQQVDFYGLVHFGVTNQMTNMQGPVTVLQTGGGNLLL